MKIYFPFFIFNFAFFILYPMPKILSGPYGSLIHDRLTHEQASKHEREQLTSPHAILYHSRAVQLNRDVATDYLNAGAEVSTTNTFGARHLLKRASQDYAAVIRSHAELVRSVLEKTGATHQEVAVSFGPYGDCYKPEEGPASISEGRDFTQAASEPLVSLTGPVHYALYETINNGVEARGIVAAWRTISKHVRNDLTAVVSVIVQPDGSRLLDGEPLADLLAELHRDASDLNVVFGLNCIPGKAIQPALRHLEQVSPQVLSRVEFLYPNASDTDPRELEQSPENLVSHAAHEVAHLLHEVVRLQESKLPHGRTLKTNECCGGTPERTATISSRFQAHS